MTTASQELQADGGSGQIPRRHDDLVRRFIGAIEQRDADAYAALFAEDVVAHHPLGRPIELPAVWWCELTDDALIAAARGYFDTP